MQIDFLADHADWIPTLATWFREEWPDASTQHDPAAQFARACNRYRIPLALVATETRQVVGTVSLLERSVASHAHLGPWVTERARRLECTDVYIGVSTAREYYEGLGWIFVGDGVAGGETVGVLRKTLGDSAA
jgi:hypothetical protein